MQGRTIPKIRLWAIAGLVLALFGSAQAGEEAYLKLMVTNCDGEMLDGVQVGVAVVRNAQSIERVSASTDDGYVEFHFSNLLPGDKARVSVTPAGGSSDADHQYTYVGEGQDDVAPWDLGGHFACPDDWWDPGEQIIQCTCDTAP